MAETAKRLSQRVKQALTKGGKSATESSSDDDSELSKKETEQGAQDEKRQGKGGLLSRIAAFEKAAADAEDPKVMAAKISEFSDRKKYNFAGGLKRDLENTRAALRAVTLDEKTCTFGDLFEFTEGQIANLNRILQNLKKAGEIDFKPEVFFVGMHKSEVIELLPKFWEGAYTVDAENVFRPGRNQKDVPEEERKGRSYVVENLKTKDIKDCSICGEQVVTTDRITVRDKVYHLRCIKCVVCGSSPREKADFVTFDGKLCCSVECIKNYDAAHLAQKRS